MGSHFSEKRPSAQNKIYAGSPGMTKDREPPAQLRYLGIIKSA
jgi:hypothetical protein